MREHCILCCLKHLGQSVVLVMEARQGYPLHVWLAVAHMAEAADEMVEQYPRVAAMIRTERLLYTDDPDNYNPRLMSLIKWVARIDRRLGEQQ